MKRPLLLFLLLLLLPHTLPAQQQRTPLQRAQTYSWYVRALRGDSVIAAGRVRAATADAIRIDTTMVQLSDVTVLERRTSTGGGWKTGAIIGTVFMTVVFTGAAEMTDSPSDNHPGVFLLAALVGVPLGGFIGGTVKPGEHVWQPIWPAPN